MYLIYFIVAMSLLQLFMRIPGLLPVLVIAYAIYSYLQSRRLRQSSVIFPYLNAYCSNDTRTETKQKPKKDVIDVEYTEHEI